MLRKAGSKPKGVARGSRARAKAQVKVTLEDMYIHQENTNL